MHTTSNTHTRAHTHVTLRRSLTWVVKLAACISGIDLFGIEPCHRCHLNFGFGTSPESPPCHHTAPPPPIASSAPSSSEWKMDGTPATHCSISTRFFASRSPSTRSKLLTTPRQKNDWEKKIDSFISLLQMLAPHFIRLSPVKYIPPTQAKAHRGQKPAKPLIEIAILSDEISPRHRFTNRVVISLGQVRCLFISPPSAYNDAVFILLRCWGDKMASQRWPTLRAAAGNSCQKLAR